MIVETSAIVGVMMAPNTQKLSLATPESPATIILRNADPIDVIGIEPAMIFARMTMVAAKVEELKESGKDMPIAIEWLDRDDATE